MRLYFLLVLILTMFQVNYSMEDSSSNKLIRAIEKDKSIKKIAKIIASGVDCNIRDKRGNTALHHAIKNLPASFIYKPNEESIVKYKEKIELLLKSGAEVNIKNNKKKTALNFMVEVCNTCWLINQALESMDLTVYPDMLIKILDPYFSDLKFKFEYQKNSFNELLNLMAPLDAHTQAEDRKNHKSLTPLSIAAKMGNFDAVKIILSHGYYSEQEIKDAIKCARDYDYQNEINTFRSGDSHQLYENAITEFFSQFIKNNKKVVGLLLNYLIGLKLLEKKSLPREIAYLIVQKYAFNANNDFIMPKIETQTNRYQQQEFAIIDAQNGCVLQ